MARQQHELTDSIIEEKSVKALNNLFLEELGDKEHPLKLACENAIQNNYMAGLPSKGRLAELIGPILSPELKLINAKGKDYDDGSDVKTAITCTRSNGQVIANISNIKSKTGPLRVLIYFHLEDLYRFFIIPYEAYSHINSSITIEFTTVTGRIGKSKFLNYEVDNLRQVYAPLSHYF